MTSAAHTHSSSDDHPSYLTAKRGILSWLVTVDHKRIGVMYLISLLLFFLIAGLLALTIRFELWTPAGDVVDADTYNRIFTLHGAIMVFLFVVPSIPASLGNIVLPLMLGTNDVAFPRLNLTSYYLYVIGALFFVASLLLGGIDTGWTFYTPYSTGAVGGVISALTGVVILGFSSILTGVNFLVTIHKMRAPGMSWLRMPLMMWSLYGTGVIQLLATPVLAITLLLLIIERTMGVGIFDPKLGGDPVLFQHFFWFYSHPAVYVMILPAMGVISELIAVHSQKNIFGYKAIAYSSLAIAMISFFVWGHHLFVSGQSEVATAAFSLLTFAVGIPTAIKVFSWVATLYKGSIVLNTPMIYALSFLALFTIGGLTGIFLGALSIDVHLHDTYFIVAHFHYTMMGGVVIAFLGGLHHWWPKFTGKTYSEPWGRFAAILIFIGFNTTFIAQFILGSRGMPRRYYSYDKIASHLVSEFQTLHQISSLGAAVLGVGFFVILFYLMHSLFSGAPAPANPWNGKTLEWRTESPPIEHNFVTLPVCDEGPYEFDVIAKEGV